MLKLKQLILISIIFISVIGFNNTNAQSEWEFNAGLYGWLAGMQGDIGIANQDQQFEASVSDLLKNVKFTVGSHFEARNPHVSLIADIFFVGLGNEAEIQRTIGDSTIVDTTFVRNVEVNLDEWIIEGAVGYRVSEVFELLVASRIYAMNVEMLVEGEEIGTRNKTWVDIFFGARYLTSFADNWYASLRADIGFGGSTFAWFGNASLGYRFSELFSLAFAYRILSVDYESGSGVEYFKYDVVQNGFGLGAVFSF